MKILHIVPSYKPAYVYGGPIVSVSQLCENQSDSGLDVDVFTTTANGATELKVAAGITQVIDGVSVTFYRRITGDHTHVSPALWTHLWLKCKKYDIIHIHSWWSPLVIIATLICIIRGTKPVLAPRGMMGSYTFGSIHSPAKKAIHKFIGRRLLKKTVLHATTKMELEDCQKINPNWENFILPNIVNLPHYLPHRKGNDIFTLVFFSRIDPKKGLELVFRALTEIEFPFILKIAGKGEQKYINSLKKLSLTLGISDNIQWVGWKGAEEKFEFLASADLMILTSYNENFANVVVESLAVGTPVLVSNKVGLFDYVQREDQGWVCDLSEKHVVDALVSAHTEVQKRKRIQNQSPQKIKNDFSGSRLAKKYIEAYSTILN